MDWNGWKYIITWGVGLEVYGKGDERRLWDIDRQIVIAEYTFYQRVEASNIIIN